MQYRFIKMSRPKTTVGNITPAVATGLWPAIRSAITTDLGAMLNSAERPVTFAGNTLTTASIATGDGTARYVIAMTPDAADGRILHVVSTGNYGSATRSVAMDFIIDKKGKCRFNSAETWSWRDRWR
jgi:hypothetical protein